MQLKTTNEQDLQLVMSYHDRSGCSFSSNAYAESSVWPRATAVSVYPQVEGMLSFERENSIGPLSSGLSSE